MTPAELAREAILATDTEREELIERHFDVLPHEARESFTRDALRWEFWRGLQLLGEKYLAPEEFIEIFVGRYESIVRPVNRTLH